MNHLSLDWRQVIFKETSSLLKEVNNPRKKIPLYLSNRIL
jgi:hypothetical protein